jgi:hypothetical protein
MKVALFLSFQSDKVSGPGAHRHANENFVYAIEHDLVFDFEFRPPRELPPGPGRTPAVGPATLRKPGSRIRVRGRAGEDNRGPVDVIRTSLRAYEPEDVPDTIIREMIAAHNAGRRNCAIDLRVWWKAFFKAMLEFMTRTSADTFNLARPDAEAPVLNTFTHVRKDAKADVDVTAVEQEEFLNIPCEIKSIELGKETPPTTVKIVVTLLLRNLPAEDHRKVAVALIAADWTKLYHVGTTKFDPKTRKDSERPDPWFKAKDLVPANDKERALKTWETNIARYLFNHANFARGESIRKEVVTATLGDIAKPVVQVVQKVRDLIDARLVTANHWADNREDWNTEQYQRKLSDMLGFIHQTRWYCSPVRFRRLIAGNPKEVSALSVNPDAPSEQNAMLGFREVMTADLTTRKDPGAALTFQFGTGHCGEHAEASFSVIQALMDASPPQKFLNAVFTGNANVDHAFVVGGFLVEEVIETKNQFDDSPGGKGDARKLFDLEDHIKRNRGVEMWVLDPYLSPTSSAPTAAGLLGRINDPARGQKATNFLNFAGQISSIPPTFVSRASVKGV